MTVTNLWIAGAELASATPEFTEVSGGNFTTSTTVARSGARSFRTTGTTYGTKVFGADHDQFRCGFHFQHNDALAANDEPEIIAFWNGTSKHIRVIADFPNGKIEIRNGSTVLASVAILPIVATSTLYFIGIDINLASSGWIEMWVDGNSVASYSGDLSSHTMNLATFGATVVTDGWANYLYFDDIYIDDTAGESAAASPPDIRFDWVAVDGNGSQSDWVGSDANSVDNYLLVDDYPHDSDTTYVESETSADKDLYTCADYTLPADYSILAVFPTAIAKKTNAAGADTIQMGMKNGGGTAYYFANALTTDYLIIQERRAGQPVTDSAWDEAAIDALEIGFNHT